MKAPKLIRRVPPEYPEDALLSRLQGTVVIAALISREGAVEKVHVISSPDPRLTQATLEAVRRWRYQPATLHGELVPVCLAVTATYRLR